MSYSSRPLLMIIIVVLMKHHMLLLNVRSMSSSHIIYSSKWLASTYWLIDIQWNLSIPATLRTNYKVPGLTGWLDFREVFNVKDDSINPCVPDVLATILSKVGYNSEAWNSKGFRCNVLLKVISRPVSLWIIITIDWHLKTAKTHKNQYLP